MAQNKLRVGIVGCGGIAQAHAGAYTQIPDVEVVSVYDVSRPSAARMAAATGAHAARSLEEMAAGHLDAVSICTPPATHLAVSRVFLSAGIAVLCEKPLEADLRNARKLALEVEKRDGLFMTAYCHRFHPAIIELRALIDSGALGKAIFFRNIFGGYYSLKGNHRAKPELSGGGSIIDNCSHSVDLYRFLVGEPTAVQAFGGSIMQKAPVEDFGMLHLSNNDRVFGEITASYSLKVCGNWVEWYGTSGTAIVSY